jgi:c-di-GMP-binding flagellar brake protein YcgR
MPTSIERIKKESRKHARIAIYLKAAGTQDPKLADSTISSYNFSVGGAMLVITPQIKAETDLKTGEEIILSFVISTKAGITTVPSQIVWIKEKVLTPENEEASCIGVKFAEISEATKTLISNFLKGEIEKDQKSKKKTCRDCSFFKDNPTSKYAYCESHRITVLNSDENLTLSFNQIYLYPCKEFKPKN